MQLVAWEVISTVELDTVVHGGAAMTFRIEVQKRIDDGPATYRARVFRTGESGALLADDSYTPSTQLTFTSGTDAMAAVFGDLDRVLDIPTSQLS